MELNSTLLRERFSLTDTQSEEPVPVVAASNRIPLTLHDATGAAVETFVVRSQNMHGAIRMVAQILQSFMRVGPIMAREVPFDFEETWDRINSEHELAYNPQRWIVVYNKGKPIYSAGEYQPFLDVIEKCDAINPGNYDRAVHIAEDMFQKMGKKFAIQHESNIAMVVNVKPDIGRCGLILRNPFKTTTFNFVAEAKDTEREVSPLSCLNTCAAFLEGIQLAVKIGMGNEKMRMKLIEKYSPEAKEVRSALKRMAQLNAAVSELENRLTVYYRPEKPEFPQLVREAENFQRKLIEMNGVPETPPPPPA